MAAVNESCIPITMEDDGTMEYSFLRGPLGGHGVACVDVICLYISVRIVQGHCGTLLTCISDDGSFQ
jgi:hypothetical protein